MPGDPPHPWWGQGLAPHRQWPGVTIEFPVVWVPAHGPIPTRSRWESPDGRFYFDRDAADRACDFFPEFLTHHIGEFAGRRFTLLDYQAKLLTRPLFGWRRTSDGFRRFRKVFAFIPKASGKSPWGAGTGLYLMLCDGEAAAEVYAVAADRNQARIVHTNAKIMVETSPMLAERCQIVKDAIVSGQSTYQVLSSDAATKHGFRPHGVIFDELHAQPNRDLFEALAKSMGKRRQPLMVLITHAGDDDEGICAEEYELAKKVLSGTLPDETCLPVIFEADAADDWTDPDVWRRVNPGHGVTIKHEAIVTDCEEAKAEPRKLNDFLRFRLNRWVNQATAWIPIDWWEACTDPLPRDEELARSVCALGIDMAQKIDLAAAVAVFRLPLAEAEAIATTTEAVVVDETGTVSKRAFSLNYRLAVVPAFWLPADTLRDRVKQDGVPYDIWAQQGLLRTTDGAIIDSEAIVAYVSGELVRRFPLLKQGQVGYDPAFATELSIRLMSQGFTTVEVLQNYKHLSEACQVFEALVKAKRVLHGGHRLLRWNLENVAIKRDDAGRIRVVKPKKAAKRIDGVVATIIALSRLLVMPAPTPSVYLTRGIRTLGQ